MEPLKENKRNYVDAILADVDKEDWMPTDLVEYWLNIVCPLVNNYDATLLCRYIPKLSAQSMQKLWDASAEDYGNHLAEKVWQSQDHIAAEKISKMAMRRVLETTFGRLAPTDPDIQDHIAAEKISKMAMRRVLDTTFGRLAPTDPDIESVYMHWKSTRDKPNRKGKCSAARHTQKWYLSRSLRSRGF